MAGRFERSDDDDDPSNTNNVSRRHSILFASAPPPPPRAASPPLFSGQQDDEHCPCQGAYDTGNVHGGKHYVWMAFLNYDNGEDMYRREQWGREYMLIPINYMTCVLSGSWIFHCQMFFWNQLQRTFVTFSVDAYHRRVFSDTQKEFARGWTFLRIAVTPRQEATMYDFFMEQVRMRKPFNQMGAYLLFLRPTDIGERAWFCSQLDVAALQRAGFLAGIAPFSTGPAKLYTLIKSRAEFDVLETPNPVRTKDVYAYIGQQQLPGGSAPPTPGGGSAPTPPGVRGGAERHLSGTRGGAERQLGLDFDF